MRWKVFQREWGVPRSLSVWAVVTHRLTHTAESSHTCACVWVWECVCVRVEKEEGREIEKTAKERERELHGNSCSNTKWSLLAHDLSFAPFPSISPAQLIFIPSHFQHVVPLCFFKKNQQFINLPHLVVLDIFILSVACRLKPNSCKCRVNLPTEKKIMSWFKNE